MDRARSGCARSEAAGDGGKLRLSMNVSLHIDRLVLDNLPMDVVAHEFIREHFIMGQRIANVVQ